MNKRKFLRELENRLAILEEKEIKDISNEYRDIIEEKIKAGKIEAEAVAEFGSIDELCSEILKAYKVNPKFANRDDDDDFDDTEINAKTFQDWIKNIASDLSDFIKDIGKNFDHKGKPISLELVIEIFIKIIILLVILAVLRWPFQAIGYIGRNLFTISFSPIDFVFSILWWILSTIVYLGLAIFIFWALFKEYFNAIEFKESKPETSDPEEKPLKKESKTNAIIDEQIQGNHKADMVVSKEGESSSNPFLILIRVFGVICFLIPLWLAQAVIIFVLVLTIYYIVTGIQIIGLPIILFGLVLGIGAFADFIYNLLFKIKKIKVSNIVTMIISVPIMLVGGVILAYNILSFDYINEAPNYLINYHTTEKTFQIDSEKKLSFRHNYKIEYVTDDNYEEDKIKLIISYSKTIHQIKNISMYEKDDECIINFEIIDVAKLKELKNVYDSLINDLKDGRVYNYNKLYQPSITIIGNVDTIEAIR